MRLAYIQIDISRCLQVNRVGIYNLILRGTAVLLDIETQQHGQARPTRLITNMSTEEIFGRGLAAQDSWKPFVCE